MCGADGIDCGAERSAIGGPRAAATARRWQPPNIERLSNTIPGMLLIALCVVVCISFMEIELGFRFSFICVAMCSLWRSFSAASLRAALYRRANKEIAGFVMILMF